MSIDKLIIFQKIYDFLLWLYPLINKIPKSHRLVLGRGIEEIGLNLLLLSIEANKIRDDTRRVVQLKISEELDKIRILIRLTKDLRFMSISQYQYAAEKVNEIGRILNGWMNSNKKSDNLHKR
jgi:hypothetical protein